ncbi:MAG: sulfur carrier protein ThiS adenylyltransferase ThiF [Desulfobulbaceae bacterium]|nr:sulfur carrier protein ThiS adenylyltransferase ThiF [Desulfobulbaceae bacterium]
MRVGFAGVGGIGSNVAWMLVRSGLQELVLVDFDRVEAGNLNRQFYFADQVGQFKVEALAHNLSRIKPQLAIRIEKERLHSGNSALLFSDCDVVVEGLDGREDKKMLLESLNHGQQVISACGIAGAALDGILVRRIGHCQVVGDFSSDCAHAPLFAHKVSAVAAHMAALVMKEAGKRHEP